MVKEVNISIKSLGICNKHCMNIVLIDINRNHYHYGLHNLQYMQY